MKKALLLSLGLIATSSVHAKDKALPTIDQQVSYTLGTDLARNFAQQGLKINIDALVLGMQDVINNQPLKLTEEEMKSAVMTKKKELAEKHQKQQQQLAEANAQKGDAFLSKNKSESGVKVLKSGLQYKVIKAGKGDTAKEGEYITANYEGRLIDGTVFDSSYKRGAPIEFQVTDVIKGWGEAFKLMKAGAIWEIYVPPALGYGTQGAGQIIGPNETLIFKIEFIKSSPEKSTAEAPAN